MCNTVNVYTSDSRRVGDDWVTQWETVNIYTSDS